MIKRMLAAVAQFVLFLMCFAAGSFAPPLNLRQVLGVTPEGTRIFLWDGVVLMALLCVAILAVEAARRRLASWGPWTLGAFVLAGLVGYMLRLGFLTV